VVKFASLDLTSGERASIARRGSRVGLCLALAALGRIEQSEAWPGLGVPEVLRVGDWLPEIEG
jgi:hypothetical protein